MKKICSLVLSASMAFGCFGASAAALPDVYEEAIFNVKSIGLMIGTDDGEFYPEKEISRAEFAAIASRLCGLTDSIGTAATVFADVPESMWASGYINTAYNLGIINGYDDGTFRPDTLLTGEQALKMIVCALGYQIQAESMGGYPSGYLAVATKLGINKGVNADLKSNITRGDVALFLNNALDVYPMERVIAPNEESYEINGDTLLDKLSSAKKTQFFEGVVTANHITALDGESNLNRDEVLIGDRLYKTGTTKVGEYLGQMVRIYVEDSNKSIPVIISVNPLPDSNNTLVLKADDVENISISELTYYISDDKTRTLSLDYTNNYIYNGKSIKKKDLTNNHLKIFNGSYVLLDADGNNRYETLFINGVVKTFTACDDATLRAGAYVDTNYGFDEYLKVKTFGDFMGDETYRAIIMFDLSELKPTDKITSARLVLTTSHDLPGEEKRVGVFTETQIGWDEANVTWSSLLHYFYQYGGVEGGNTWDRPKYSETEYHYQVPRFYSLPVIATEYAVTGDEYYAYKAIRELQDFITDKGGVYTTAGDINTRGLHPRTLDAAARENNTYKSLANLMKSKYMDAETFTAYMKHMWDLANSLYQNPPNDGNWLQGVMTSVLRVGYRFPEFYNSYNGINWYESARDVLENFIFTDSYEDGSYKEGVDSYARGVATTMVGFKNTMLELGSDVSERYDEVLIKAMYYNAVLCTPYGETVQYGDAGLSSRYNSPSFKEIAKYYGEDELLYIDTFGREGTQPTWTSRAYYGSKEAMLRSSWSTDALYMFTNVHEKGGHNHADDNSVTVAAFGRTLLTDAGIFTYTSTNPLRQWGQSTRAHNTVEINNTTQTGNGSNSGGEYGPGTIDHFVTDNSFDFLSMTTHNNPGFTHTRNTMFSKQNYWIITDYVVPEDPSKENSYKQLWHMRPDAMLSSDSSANIIRSNYPSGANIIIASADDDIAVREELGWWDKSNNEVYESNYGYFEKNQSGITTMATVLVPYKDAADAQISAELLDVGVTSDKATAMKINSLINRSSTTGWYYLSYESAPYATRTFGKYSTDGQLAFVLENDNIGEISTINIKDGSFVSDSKGDCVAILPQKVSSASFEWKGTRLEIFTDENINLTGAKLKSFDTTDVLINGEAVSFSLSDDGYVVIGISESAPDASGGNASTKGELGVRPGTDSSSGSGGGGSHTGGSSIGGFGGSAPLGMTGFTDIAGHWAAADINYLAGRGIVTDRTITLFAPDTNITRAEFLTLMLRITGTSAKEYRGEFEDVSATDWYAGNIAAALGLGLISHDTKFRPNDLVTREEMVKIAVNAYGLGHDLPKASDLEFTDKSEISGWAKDFVSIGVKLGFVTGMPDGSFAPRAQSTRAQSAVIAKRVLDKSAE